MLINNTQKREPNSKPRTSKKTRQSSTVVKNAKSTKPYIPTPMVFECEWYRSTQDGMERMITGDVETLFVQCVMLVVHTSRRQYRLTTLQRAYGASLYKARSSLGDTFEGKLKNLLVWAKKLTKMLDQMYKNTTNLPLHGKAHKLYYIMAGGTIRGEDEVGL